MTLELTRHELMILRGLANGLQSKEIALLLERSTPTVEMYVRRLFRKMNARSRAHLVALAIRENLLDKSDLPIPEGPACSR